MEVIGWPNNVNQKILQETSITEGDGGKVEDSSSNGFKETRATSLVTPKKYNVKMDFDWGGAGSEFQYPIDENGVTEYDRFIRWFQFVHQKGAKPFWFPCITKQPIDSITYGKASTMALYKITSSLTESNSGYSMSISMTWEEVYSGVINMPNQSGITITSVSGKDGKAKCTYNSIPSCTPAVNLFYVSYTKDDTETPLPINTIKLENNILNLSFEKIREVSPSETGEIEINVYYKKDTEDELKFTYSVNI